MGPYASLVDLVPCDADATPPTAEPTPGIAFAGSILALLSDASGKFDGFVLETAQGRERCFETGDLEIAGLVQRAWRERRTVSVFVAPGSLRRPVAIILEDNP